MGVTKKVNSLLQPVEKKIQNHLVQMNVSCHRLILFDSISVSTDQKCLFFLRVGITRSFGNFCFFLFVVIVDGVVVVVHCFHSEFKLNVN